MTRTQRTAANAVRPRTPAIVANADAFAPLRAGNASVLAIAATPPCARCPHTGQTIPVEEVREPSLASQFPAVGRRRRAATDRHAGVRHADFNVARHRRPDPLPPSGDTLEFLQATRPTRRRQFTPVRPQSTACNGGYNAGYACLPTFCRAIVFACQYQVAGRRTRQPLERRQDAAPEMNRDPLV